MSTYLVELPRLPLGEKLTEAFDWTKDTFGGLFDLVSDLIGSATDGLGTVLTTLDPLIMVVILAALALAVCGWRFGLVALVGLLLVVSIEQWAGAMETLAVVIVSTLVAVLIGVPVGILAAKSRAASMVIKPVMDLMQTMPAFVWLVPVVMLFSIGVVPAVVATVIFALPPGVRLTELGIRSVDQEMVEASQAFGATGRQTLLGVQLPLALPTIMAGINQVIMLALSMAVIAGLVGAEGLGGQVAAAIATLDLGLGFEAGLSVVILAIYLDRVTAALGKPGGATGLRALLALRQPSAARTSAAPSGTLDEPAVDETTPVVGTHAVKVGG